MTFCEDLSLVCCLIYDNFMSTVDQILQFPVIWHHCTVCTTGAFVQELFKCDSYL